MIYDTSAGLLNGTRARRRARADGAVHGDQPRRREVPLRQQRRRRDLEDGRAVPRASASSRALQFNAGNFHAGGGFMPFGFHGVFAALTGGVVFALQGFEQAVQLAGEARESQTAICRARSSRRWRSARCSTRCCRSCMIGALDPANIARRLAQAARHRRVRRTAPGTRSRSRSAPAGSRRCCSSTRSSRRRAPASSTSAPRARLSYALGEEREMPSALAKTNSEGRAGRRRSSSPR